MKRLRKIAKVAGIGIGTASFAAVAFVGFCAVRGIPVQEPPKTPDLHVTITPERVARGQKLADVLCNQCHADEATGRLTGKRMDDTPPEFGEVFSQNITQHRAKGIGAWTDGQIAYFVRTGVRPNGTYAPPWMVKLPLLSDEDMASIIAYLRSDDPRVAASDADPPGRTKPALLSKVLANTVIKPLPYPSQPVPMPAKTDRLAYGRYLAINYDCYACHSASFTKLDPLLPERSAGYFGGGNELKGADGQTIRTANLTPDDDTGIGRLSEAQFIRAVKEGFRPDGRVLRAPMSPRPSLEDDEVSAIYTYLRSLPKIKNPIQRDLAPPSPGDDPGHRAFVSYGCASCHTETGVGPGGADLRRANEHWATDEELRTWIDDAPKLRPGTRMPGWRGVIAEKDYGPLIGHVRKLARTPRAAAR
jgi:mono/diheme cytochrome c family protein